VLDYEEILEELKKNNKYMFSENDLFILGLQKKEVKAFIKNGLGKGDIKKLVKNTYYLNDLTSVDLPFEIVVDKFFGGSGYYLGLGYALKYWGFKAENVDTVIFNRKKNLNGVRVEIGKYKFNFRFMDIDLFFGEIRVPSSSTMVNISDFEKTFLDALVFLGKDSSIDVICNSLELLKEKLKPRKFARYVVRTNNKAVIKRAGYVMDRLLKFMEADILLKYSGSGKLLLDPANEEKGDLDGKWGIIVNTKC